MSTDNSKVVMSHPEVQNRIKRIAWQLLEEFYGEKELILAGVAPRGYSLASHLQAELAKISEFTLSLHAIEINKDDPLGKAAELKPALNPANEKAINVVVVDDVLKSGSTLIYAVKHFLDKPIKSMKTVVLVDRNHKRFPVKADFKGLSLSTSMHEHVQVHIENEPFRIEVS